MDIHRNQVANRGGQMGLKHEGILRACLSTPANKMGGTYAHQDLFEMAAAYLFHIIDQKPFLEGNRKVAALASLYFLYLHDYDVIAPPEDLLGLIQGIAEGKRTKMQAADFFRKNSMATGQEEE